MDVPEISEVMREEVWLLLADADAPVRVTHLYDDEGEPAATWEEAERFVAGPLPTGGWLSDYTEKYRVRAPH